MVTWSMVPAIGVRHQKSPWTIGSGDSKEVSNRRRSYCWEDRFRIGEKQNATHMHAGLQKSCFQLPATEPQQNPGPKTLTPAFLHDGGLNFHGFFLPNQVTFLLIPPPSVTSCLKIKAGRGSHSWSTMDVTCLSLPTVFETWLSLCSKIIWKPDRFSPQFSLPEAKHTFPKAIPLSMRYSAFFTTLTKKENTDEKSFAGETRELRYFIPLLGLLEQH